MKQDDTRKTGRTARGPRAEGDSRADILEAARGLFAARGFRATTTRQVAERAGVDVALIHHFFGTKAGLFEAVIDLPRIGGEVEASFTSADADPAEAIARLYLERLFTHDLATFSAVLRTVVSGGEEMPWLRGLMKERLLSVAERALSGPDAALRAEIIGAQMIGLLVLRHIVQIEPIASASTDEIVRRIAPALRALVDVDGG